LLMSVLKREAPNMTTTERLSGVWALMRHDMQDHISRDDRVTELETLEQMLYYCKVIMFIETLEQMLYYYKVAIGAYGGAVVKMVQAMQGDNHTPSNIKRALKVVANKTMSLTQGEIEDADLLEMSTIFGWIGVDVDNVIDRTQKTLPFLPMYYVFKDPVRKTLCISIRGTFGLADIVTDAYAEHIQVVFPPVDPDLYPEYYNIKDKESERQREREAEAQREIDRERAPKQATLSPKTTGQSPKGQELSTFSSGVAPKGIKRKGSRLAQIFSSDSAKNKAKDADRDRDADKKRDKFNLRDIGCVPIDSSYFAHKGMLCSASMLYYAVFPLLQREFPRLRREGYSIVTCGHSLGAGVAALLALLLRQTPEFVSARCWGYGCPAIVSPPLSQVMAQYCTTCVFQYDMVPRLSIRSAVNVANRIQHLSNLKKDK
ncbi:hypothetical protein KIPB_007068, partial [Kipferlia bialata]